LAAVRADGLLEERTLPYDEEQIERLLRRCPGPPLLEHQPTPSNTSRAA
jgi:hypothetical protein